jgi:molybdate transport system ATP-binding protein
VTVLFGPSGAGKSSVLLAVAGLLRASGRVAVGDAVLQDGAAGVWVPPERRRLGGVFPDARLFPHLTVAGNLRYGLKRAPAGPVGFDEVVRLLGIGPVLDRRPAGLSGGERQRVAIGRALLAQPRMLLMDEPLASLDAARKAEILPYLARLKAALGIPVLYVTHAMDEVARLADHLVLIEAGRVVASGDVASMTGRADFSIAAREDAGSVLSAVVAGHAPERGLSRLDLAGSPLWVPLVEADVGAVLRVRVPAREVILARGAAGETSVHNVLAGTVRAVRMQVARHAALVEVALPGGAVLLARVTRDAVERLGFGPGAPVLAMVKSVSVEVLL